MIIGICTPNAGNVSPEHHRHLLEMENSNRQHQFYHIEVDTMIVGKARNMLLDRGLSGTPAEVFLFVDNDVLVPPNAAVLCEQALSLGQVVSGLYFARRPPYTPQAYTVAHEPGLEGLYWPLIDYPAQGMMVVDAVGGGLFAVSREVVLHMKTVWEERMNHVLRDLRESMPVNFVPDFDWLAQYARQLSPWFEFLDKKGEDLYFCERVKEAGHIVWLNVDVKGLHLGEMIFEERHFTYLRDNNLVSRVPVGDAAGVHAAQPIREAASGAEDKHENTNTASPGSQAVEWRDNLSDPSRRIGVGGSISGSFFGQKKG